MRWYIIEREHRPGLPTVHVTGELIGFVDRRGRAWPVTGGGLHVIGREELIAIPGGAAALARWHAGDDDAYQALRDVISEELESLAADEAAAAARRELRSV